MHLGAAGVALRIEKKIVEAELVAPAVKSEASRATESARGILDGGYLHEQPNAAQACTRFLPLHDAVAAFAEGHDMSAPSEPQKIEIARQTSNLGRGLSASRSAPVIVY
jgi:hypothetical protein